MYRIKLVQQHRLYGPKLVWLNGRWLHYLYHQSKAFPLVSPRDLLTTFWTIL